MDIVSFPYKKVKFECEVNKGSFFGYEEMFLCWYEFVKDVDGKMQTFHENFFILKRGEFYKVRKFYDDQEMKRWSLSSIPLKQIYEEFENPLVYLSSIFCSNFRDEKGKITKIVDNCSFQRILRRLIILHFEENKHSYTMAQESKSFIELRDDDLLYNNIFEKFRDEIKRKNY